MNSTKFIIGILAIVVIYLNIQLFSMYPRSFREAYLPDAFGPCKREIIYNFPHDSQHTDNTSHIDPNLLLAQWNATGRNRVLSMPRSKPSYLTIGIPTTKWKDGKNSLLRTLTSITEETAAHEQLNVVVVVMLLDDDQAYNNMLARHCLHSFGFQIAIGFLHLYEPLLSKSTKKTNLQAIEIMSHYAANLSTFYLHLEDDILCAPSYFHQIKHFINSKGLRVLASWSLIEFSELAFVGKLIKTVDLHKLSTFLQLFDEQAENDEQLLTMFRHTMLQGKIIMMKPTLFQRQGGEDQQQDRFFLGQKKVIQGDDPEGQVLSNMPAIGQNVPEFAYRGGSNMFWAKSVSAGDYLTVVFTEDVMIDKIDIHTGFSEDEEPDDEEADTYILHGAQIELSPKLLKIDIANNKVICASYKIIGDFHQGKFNASELLQKTHKKKTKCLNIRVTEDHSGSVMFQRISVFVKKEQ